MPQGIGGGGSGCIAPPFSISGLDGSKWSLALSNRFTHRVKNTRYPFYGKLGGPQSQSGRFGEEKTVLEPEMELGPSSSLAVTTPIQLFQLL
jgi:hypothetical protein